MTAAITAAVGATVVGGYIAKKGAEKQADAMDRASESQASAAADNLAFAQEQWDVYERKILPLELEAQSLGIDAQQLAQQRGEDEYAMYQDYYQPMQIKMSELAMEGTEDRTEAVTRDAATRVSQEFERTKAIARRNLERAGVRPDSGRQRGADKQVGIAEAATRSSEINRAREDEQTRQETTGFNMLGAATGRAPAPVAATQQGGQAGLNPSSTAAMMGNARTAMGNASLTNANAAGLKYATYGNIASGVGQAASAGLSMASDRGWFSGGGGGGGSGYNMGQSQTGTAFAPGSAAEFDAFKDGGLVPRYCSGGKVKGYADGGEIKKDSNMSASPSTGLAARWISDYQAKSSYANGGEVSGAPGIDNVPALIDGSQPAKISSGEYVIPTDVVKAKGTEFFDKLLNSYHEGPTPGDAGLRRTS